VQLNFGAASSSFSFQLRLAFDGPIKSDVTATLPSQRNKELTETTEATTHKKSIKLFKRRTEKVFSVASIQFVITKNKSSDDIPSKSLLPN